MTLVRLFWILVVVGVLSSSALAQGSAKVVKVRSGESVYKIKRGGAAQLAVIIEVDDGYHINSSRPAEKYLIPTALKLERMAGLTTSPVTYPKAKMEKFEFSKKPLSVFEGKSVLRFTARVLPSLAPGSQTLKGKLTV